MILGDYDIYKLISDQVVTGNEGGQVNPASINVRVGHTFLVPKRRFFKPVRLGDRLEYRRVEVTDGEVFYLRPGQFALATTIEHVNIPKSLAAFVQGRSSIGRAGLTVQNAGYVDPGFHGHITLELKNETKNTVAIVPGYPVAQLIFEQATPVTNPYSGKYNGQVEATGSRMYLDKEAHRA